MVDDSARRQERAAAEADPVGEVDLLALRLRAGEVSRERLALARRLGSEAAAALLDEEPAPRPLTLAQLLEVLGEGPGGLGAGAFPYALALVTLEHLRAIGLPPSQRAGLERVCLALRDFGREGSADSRAALAEARRAVWPGLEAVESADGSLGLPWLWPNESDALTGRIPLDFAVAFVAYVSVELGRDPGRALLHTLRWAGNELGILILVQDLREEALRWALGSI